MKVSRIESTPFFSFWNSLSSSVWPCTRAFLGFFFNFSAVEGVQAAGPPSKRFSGLRHGR